MRATPPLLPATLLQKRFAGVTARLGTSTRPLGGRRTPRGVHFVHPIALARRVGRVEARMVAFGAKRTSPTNMAPNATNPRSLETLLPEALAPPRTRTSQHTGQNAHLMRLPGALVAQQSLGLLFFKSMLLRDDRQR